ncbi:glycosyltransferase family 2 protein [Stenotrophomonas sp. NPDC077659]|uniref:glycosyltransferase family 2 protein n=1 Tax=Stenotrophomonas sp. NPDC077659 TaxID=3390694 RepID=UPI003D0705EA
MAAELSVVVTFHREGVFAHAALRSYLQSRQQARAAGSRVQFVLVLDNADEQTTVIVRGHPDLTGDELILATSFGDPAMARNMGIERADGTFVCILDGDDLISRDYLQRHLDAAANAPARSVLHAEVVASFGKWDGFGTQIDQRSMSFSPDMLLNANPWISAVFARREVFSEVPYVACRPDQTGYGYEDWHWSCQTVAAGFEHLTVPHTAYFYRIKQAGSVNANSTAVQAVMPPSDLFGRWGQP